MRPFVCELLACRPGDVPALKEYRVFLAPSLTIAIDQARHWASMEPWISTSGAMLRLTAEGRPVWSKGLSRPALV
jgi:hypothetical protein